MPASALFSALGSPTWVAAATLVATSMGRFGRVRPEQEAEPEEIGAGRRAASPAEPHSSGAQADESEAAPRTFDQALYIEWNTIERGNGRIKQWCGVATCYDKYALTFLGGVFLAATVQYRR